MPRQLRQFEIGGIYHIVNRGVEKRKIFQKKQDYSRFILALELFNDKKPVNIWTLVVRDTTLAGSDPARVVSDIIAQRITAHRNHKGESTVELLAFVLMPNHYHLIIREIKESGISKFMQKLGGYSTYFNQQYNRVGPLFQSRYKAVRIKGDIQLANTFVYVHTNPVELKEPAWKDLKVKNARNAIYWLENYRWSSYHDYMGRSTFPTTTQRDFFLKYYGGERGCQQAVEDWIKFKAENAQLGSEVIE